MASTLVFIFLLDSSPGNTLNRTLEDVTALGNHITDLRQCDQSRITDPIIRAINKRLKLKIIPRWRSEHDASNNLYFFNSSDAIKESGKTFSQLQAVLDNSIENSNSFEQPLKFIELNEFEDARSEDVNKISSNENENDYEDAKVSFAQTVNDSAVPEVSFADKVNISEGLTVSFTKEGNVSIDPKVSFGGEKVSFPAKLGSLVAIFETVGNVTAQTCGGTLVSPRWVLTAASCVNLLGNLYSTANQTSRSRYTVVANATNPLLDGSVHRVTRVALRPGPSDDHLRDSGGLSGQQETMSPVLALMRVEPAVRVDRLGLLGGRLPTDEDVVVYGWALVKNASGDSMLARSYPARTLEPAECARRYGLAQTSYTLCLNATADIVEGISQWCANLQMSSGGAVLCARGGRMLLAGVPLAGERAPFLAYTLAARTLYT